MSDLPHLRLTPDSVRYALLQIDEFGFGHNPEADDVILRVVRMFLPLTDQLPTAEEEAAIETNICRHCGEPIYKFRDRWAHDRTGGFGTVGCNAWRNSTGPHRRPEIDPKLKATPPRKPR